MKFNLLIITAMAFSAFSTVSYAETCADLKKMEKHQVEHHNLMQQHKRQLEELEKRLSAAEYKFNREENPHPRFIKHKVRMDALEKTVDGDLKETRTKIRHLIEGYTKAIGETKAEMGELPAIMKQEKCK